jgi:AraC-like DNA-binding protein
VFHDTAAEAAAEGFRACKRCRPELRDGAGDPQKMAVGKACDLVRKEQSGEVDRKCSVKALATAVGLTESHFCRIFKKVMGMTVGEYRASILPGTMGGFPEVVDTDQQQAFDIAQDPEECFPTPNISRDYGYENGLPLANFDCLELEKDWHRFAGVLPSIPMPFDLIDSEESSPDYFSDSINLDMMDDGFQFLDFGSSNSPDYLC